MAKRPRLRAIRAAQTYTIEEAADTLNVSTGTIRNWVRAGLPTMKSRRPYLILGDNLRTFLQNRKHDGKVPLQPGEFYCLTCKAPRRPMGMLVDYIPISDRTGRLLCLCEVCERVCNRMVSHAGLPPLARILNITIKEGRRP